MLRKGLASYLLPVLGLLMVTGCTQVEYHFADRQNEPAIRPPSTKEAAWEQRKQVLARKNVWNLKSKIALRYREEHWSFGLSWVQRTADFFVMQMTNPLTGGVVAKLTKDYNGVSLLSDDGKTYRDNDEERLLQRQSGVALPLKGMQHWVRGLSSPLYKVDKLILDANGRPKVIHQAGWKIEYSRYSDATFSAMPRKIIIMRDKDDVHLKMIAKQWQGL